MSRNIKAIFYSMPFVAVGMVLFQNLSYPSQSTVVMPANLPPALVWIQCQNNPSDASHINTTIKNTIFGVYTTANGVRTYTTYPMANAEFVIAGDSINNTCLINRTIVLYGSSDGYELNPKFANYTYSGVNNTILQQASPFINDISSQGVDAIMASSTYTLEGINCNNGSPASAQVNCGGDSPIYVSGFTIIGNSQPTGFTRGVRGIVLRAYASYINNVTVENTSGSGIVLSAYTVFAGDQKMQSQYLQCSNGAGAGIQGTLVGDVIMNNTIKNTGDHGIYVHDFGCNATGGVLTDGKMINNIILMPSYSSAQYGHDGINLEVGPGWWVLNNTVQSLDAKGYPGSGIVVNSAWATHIAGNNVIGFGYGGADPEPDLCASTTAPAQHYFGIEVCVGGRPGPAQINNNVVTFVGAPNDANYASRNHVYLAVAAGKFTTSDAVVAQNTLTPPSANHGDTGIVYSVFNPYTLLNVTSAGNLATAWPGGPTLNMAPNLASSGSSITVNTGTLPSTPGSVPPDQPLNLSIPAIVQYTPFTSTGLNNEVFIQCTAVPAIGKTGLTKDSEIIQQALAKLPTGAPVVFIGDQYLNECDVNQPIVLAGGHIYTGLNNTIIRQVVANGTPAIMASSSYLNNSPAADAPIVIQNLQVLGPFGDYSNNPSAIVPVLPAAGTIATPGIVLRSGKSTIYNVNVTETQGAGIVLSAYASDGITYASSGAMYGNNILFSMMSNTSGPGFQIIDPDPNGTGGVITDGNFELNAMAMPPGPDVPAAKFGNAASWSILANSTFASFVCAPWGATTCIENYSQGAETGSAIVVDSGYLSIVAYNYAAGFGDNATGTHYAYKILTGGNGTQGTSTVAYNTVMYENLLGFSLNNNPNLTSVQTYETDYANNKHVYLYLGVAWGNGSANVVGNAFCGMDGFDTYDGQYDVAAYDGQLSNTKYSPSSNFCFGSNIQCYCSLTDSGCIKNFVLPLQAILSNDVGLNLQVPTLAPVINMINNVQTSCMGKACP